MIIVFSRLATTITIAVAMLAYSEIARAQTDLRVEVVDSFGTPVTKGVHVRLLGGSLLVADRIGGENFLFKDIHSGTYTLAVESLGFKRISKIISVNDSTQVVRVGLVLTNIGDPESKGFTLAGTVSSCVNGLTLWVRLVGLYNDQSESAVVKPGCKFEVAGLAGGYYMVSLLDGTRLIDSTIVKVAAGSTSVSLNMRERNLRR
jgi:hypothetical protein